VIVQLNLCWYVLKVVSFRIKKSFQFVYDLLVIDITENVCINIHQFVVCCYYHLLLGASMFYIETIFISNVIQFLCLVLPIVHTGKVSYSTQFFKQFYIFVGVTLLSLGCCWSSFILPIW